MVMLLPTFPTGGFPQLMTILQKEHLRGASPSWLGESGGTLTESTTHSDDGKRRRKWGE